MQISKSTLAAAIVGAGCLSSANAHPVQYIGTLSNAGEPAAASSSHGTGSINIIFDDDTFTLKVGVTFSNLSGRTTASHIHCCTSLASTGSAGVATQVPTFINLPLGAQAGSFFQQLDMTQAASWNPAYITANGGSVSSAFAALATGIANGKAYLNIHSTLSPGGEVRAFLTPVPEPTTFALMLGGLGLVGWTARRRAARA